MGIWPEPMLISKQLCPAPKRRPCIDEHCTFRVSYRPLPASSRDGISSLQITRVDRGDRKPWRVSGIGVLTPIGIISRAMPSDFMSIERAHRGFNWSMDVLTFETLTDTLPARIVQARIDKAGRL